MKVLFLTPWYPSEADTMLGLFVLKHDEAVRAQGIDVRVIHSQGWRDMWRQWRRLRHEWGLPDVVQLNVIQKQGALALWLRKRYGIPYVIVEHFSGYLPSHNNIPKQSWHTDCMRRICAQAEVVMTVSPALEEAMQALDFKAKRWAHINNVVDDLFYKPSEVSRQHSDRKTLLHVSCFDEQAKNTFALLRAFKKLCERRDDVQLVMVGTGVDREASRRLAGELGIPDEAITWTGELQPKEVCHWMHRADAFVLTSRYETAGIVLSEAAAVGIPILSTPVGIAEELIDTETGIIVSQENVNRPTRLSEYMESVLAMPRYASRAQEFSADSIGRQLKAIYEQCTVSE